MNNARDASGARRFVLAGSLPRYLQPGRLAALRARVLDAGELLRRCTICPRDCRADRVAGELGRCGVGGNARVSAAFPHHGEEDCLRGWGGSGTLFFTGCNLRCVFCQNDDISQCAAGRAYGPDAIARMMLDLQEQGCHNINFVTPTHVVPQILEALVPAIEGGLRIPLVYNTSAYESHVALRWLDGLVDIYMPDFKLWSDATCERYLLARDYAERAREAVREMHRQVGDLHLSPEGIACRGLLVRHLVLPGLVAESAAIFRWLAQELSPDTVVNIMGQYRPSNRVCGTAFVEINRRPSHEEMCAAYRAARDAGLCRFA